MNEFGTINDREPVTERHSMSVNESLSAIQYARRLSKITASIESFFHCQIDRLESALENCRSDIERANELHETSARLAEEKLCWESARETELERLESACAQLTEGWKQLEDARREWLTSKSAMQDRENDKQKQADQLSSLTFGDSESMEQFTGDPDSRELNSDTWNEVREAIRQHRSST